MSLKAAWVTLVTKPAYLAGALVLDKTLRIANSAYPLVVMVTPDIPEEVLAVLSHQNLTIKRVGKLLPSAVSANPDSDDKKRFEDTWTKLRYAARHSPFPKKKKMFTKRGAEGVLDWLNTKSVIWALDARATALQHIQRIVLLDSDMIVMRNMDELMTMPLLPEWIAAAHVCACNPRKIPDYPTDWSVMMKKKKL